MNLDKLCAFVANLAIIIDDLFRLRAERHDRLNWKDNGLQEGWNANETGEFVKVVPDYNETQMEYKMSSCGWRYPTGLRLVDAANLDGETGSVTIAAHRLRARRDILALMFRVRRWNKGTERKCNWIVSARTDNAIYALRCQRNAIVTEGEREQQEIFEYNMKLLGDDDTQLEEWRNERYECYSYREQTRETFQMRPRFSRHMKQ